jgi:methyltransferase
MGAARLVELAFSRRNIKSLGPSREGAGSKRTFPIMVALHVTTIAGTFLWGRKARPGWLALLLLAQPFRTWVLLSLGHRWNARGAVARDLQLATAGPYAYVRHPNYTIVLLELATLPAGFGLNRLSVAATLVNAALLKVRIEDEEALLMELPGYRDHFARKPRFLPFLF